MMSTQHIDDAFPCRIDDPVAEATIVDAIRGKFPSKNPDVGIGLRQIEQVKEQSFVQQHDTAVL